MGNRVREALRKSATYVRDVVASEPPRLIYVSGSPDSHNLGDNTLFKAHQALFPGFAFVRYGSGGRALRWLSRGMGVRGAALLAGGTLINRWGHGAAQECLDLFGDLYVLGTGVGQASFWSTRPGWRDHLPAWKRVLERAAYVGVRGPLSAATLREAGLAHVEVIGDPVLVFAEPGPPAQGPASRCLGLNIGESRGNVWGSEERILQESVALAGLARDAGWKLLWFVVSPEDAGMAREAAAASGGEVLELYHDHRPYLERVEAVSVFVGMKLHAVVLAACAYVPSLMLEYRPKCRDFMQSIGHEHVTLRTDEMEARDLWERVRDLEGDRSRHAARLYESILPVRRRLTERAEEIATRLRSR
jgi:hypothetical protein